MRTKHIITLSGSLLLAFSLLALNIEFKKIHVLKKNTKFHAVADSLRDGDIIFQTTREGQGRAIQLATHSLYTHIGILFKKDGEWQVYEAVQPVRVIPLSDFIRNGDSSKYIVKRLLKADSLLNPAQMAIMKNYLNAQLGKPYDPFFNWDDEAIYCSELVRKAYEKIGLNLGEMKALSTYDLSHPIVKSILRQRYGATIPKDVEMISPGSIYDDPSLTVVSDHYHQKTTTVVKKKLK